MACIISKEVTISETRGTFTLSTTTHQVGYARSEKSTMLNQSATWRKLLDQPSLSLSFALTALITLVRAYAKRNTTVRLNFSAPDPHKSRVPIALSLFPAGAR